MTWVKLKADYLDGFTDTLDLLIIGGWYCEGMQGKLKNDGKIRSFLIAC
jgi:hypothetical protein